MTGLHTFNDYLHHRLRKEFTNDPFRPYNADDDSLNKVLWEYADTREAEGTGADFIRGITSLYDGHFTPAQWAKAIDDFRANAGAMVRQDRKAFGEMAPQVGFTFDDFLRGHGLCIREQFDLPFDPTCNPQALRRIQPIGTNLEECGDMLRSLAAWPGLKTLKRLNFEECTLGATDANGDCPALSQLGDWPPDACPELRSLSLANCGLGGSARSQQPPRQLVAKTGFLRGTSAFRKVESLDLSSNDFDTGYPEVNPDTLRSLYAITDLHDAFPRLRHLSVANNGLVQPAYMEAIGEWSRMFPQLISLDLSLNALNEACLATIDGWDPFPQIVSLNLRGTDLDELPDSAFEDEDLFDDEDTSHQANADRDSPNGLDMIYGWGGVFPNLASIDLSGQIFEEPHALDPIGGWGRVFPHLVSINLSECGIGARAENLEGIGKWACAGQIVCLDLSHNIINTLEKFQHIGKWKNFTHLAALNLENFHLPSATVQPLCAAIEAGQFPAIECVTVGRDGNEPAQAAINQSIARWHETRYANRLKNGTAQERNWQARYEKEQAIGKSLDAPNTFLA